MTILYKVEEEQGILAKNGQMFSLPHFHFQFKCVNILSILTSKLKMGVYIWTLVSWVSLGICVTWMETSVNKQIRQNCVLFLHRVIHNMAAKLIYPLSKNYLSQKCGNQHYTCQNDNFSASIRNVFFSSIQRIISSLHN